VSETIGDRGRCNAAEEADRAGFLVPVAAPSVITGAQTSRWRLDANGIWPVSADCDRFRCATSTG
jgi:hypothetical protein